MPTVSIIIPCFNHGDSLPMALASVLAQTVDDWECIVVDDGSTEPVRPVVEAFGDDRIRTVRLNKNGGRPVARQRGLNETRGDFVCMLDADDWLYPDKLESQLELFAADPKLAAASTGLAVHDERGRLLGVRVATNDSIEIQRGSSLRAPSGGFGSFMLRGDLARAHSFDPTLERAEDRDYLTRALAGRRYAVMRRVGYAYREIYSPRTMREALTGFRCQRRIYTRRLNQAPAAAARQLAVNALKTAIYTTARRLGADRWLFTRRNDPPTADQRRRYLDARQQLEEVLRSVQRCRAA